MSNLSIEQALKVIEKYPTIESYISDNYDAEYEGEWKDNVHDLEEYYQECEELIANSIFSKKEV